MKKKWWLLFPIILLVLATVFFLSTKENLIKCGDGKCEENEIGNCFYDCTPKCTTMGESDLCSTGWQTSYQLQASENNVSREYLKETDIYDFSSPSIRLLANQLKRNTPKETAKATFKWTFENIPYDYTNDYYDCKGIKSSEILKRRFGICSTLTKLNIALLRANGIASYSRSGCFKFSQSCKLIQSFFRKQLPVYVEITKDEATEFYSTRGGLHNWVVFWIPEEGWEPPLVE